MLKRLCADPIQLTNCISYEFQMRLFEIKIDRQFDTVVCLALPACVASLI